jgi:hypothetical protein
MNKLETKHRPETSSKSGGTSSVPKADTLRVDLPDGRSASAALAKMNDVWS